MFLHFLLVLGFLYSGSYLVPTHFSTTFKPLVLFQPLQSILTIATKVTLRKNCVPPLLP